MVQQSFNGAPASLEAARAHPVRISFEISHSHLCSDSLPTDPVNKTSICHVSKLKAGKIRPEKIMKHRRGHNRVTQLQGLPQSVVNC
jgi:hypothetical protein